MAIATYDTHPLGLTWVLDEPMQRASHALRDADGGVWLVDPVDEGDAIERALALGRPAGVVQLLNRHNRDGAALARRLGVQRHVVPRQLAGAPFEIVPLLANRLWREVGLWWPEHRALIVAEAVGTSPIATGGAGPVGVHVVLRLRPPRRLAAWAPDHLLVGHGAPRHGPTTAAELAAALQRSRRDLPRVVAKLARRGR
jgi:hypothetical protein